MSSLCDLEWWEDLSLSAGSCRTGFDSLHTSQTHSAGEPWPEKTLACVINRSERFPPLVHAGIGTLINEWCKLTLERCDKWCDLFLTLQTPVCYSYWKTCFAQIDFNMRRLYANLKPNPWSQSTLMSIHHIKLAWDYILIKELLSLCRTLTLIIWNQGI